MAKKTFEEPIIVSKGDGPLSADLSEWPVIKPVATDNRIEISTAERDVLRVLLDRQRTSEIVHGGLKSLLQLTDEQASVLLGFLRRV